MSSKKSILVTGSPRSGTTWVGRMICKSPSVNYIHEPFNICGRTCSCGVNFDKWFYYITKKNGFNFYKHIEHIIGSPFILYNFLNLIAVLKNEKRVRPLINCFKSLFSTARLVKGPLAVFSAEWLASEFDISVIVLIRHPAAIVSSYKRLNWAHPFSHFLNQSLLMKELLYPFEDEIIDFVNHERDIIDQAAFLWKLIYHVVIKYQREHNNWIFVRHEDLSEDPVNGFQAIFDKLNLNFSNRIKDSIKKHSNSSNPTISDDPYSINRNSASLIKDWKNWLTDSEIGKIRIKVEDVSGKFYSDNEW